MSTATRHKNIETIKNFSRYLESRGAKSFLPDITDRVDLPSVTPDFDLDSLKFEISLDGQGYELKDVFDAVVPTEQTPYIFISKETISLLKYTTSPNFPKTGSPGAKRPQPKGFFSVFSRLKKRSLTRSFGLVSL